MHVDIRVISYYIALHFVKRKDNKNNQLRIQITGKCILCYSMQENIFAPEALQQLAGGATPWSLHKLFSGESQPQRGEIQ